jgi:hypothetical protein
VKLLFLFCLCMCLSVKLGNVMFMLMFGEYKIKRIVNVFFISWLALTFPCYILYFVCEHIFFH